MGEGLAENDRIPSYEGRRPKIAQKNRHMIFERSLVGYLADFGSCGQFILTGFVRFKQETILYRHNMVVWIVKIPVPK